MIWLYSGTPGSGKSYHAVADILKKVKRKNKNKVIANFPLNFNKEKHNKNFIYVDNSELTIDFLENYARKNHFVGMEGQTLVVVDEAQLLFNSRDWGSNSKKRMAWIKFFSQHRKYGYNFIMIAQFDLMIDKQIRSLIEYEVAHMKMNNFFWFLPTSFLLCIERWYGQRMKTGHQILPYRKKIALAYNSYSTFDEETVTKKDNSIKEDNINKVNDLPGENTSNSSFTIISNNSNSNINIPASPRVRERNAGDSRDIDNISEIKDTIENSTSDPIIKKENKVKEKNKYTFFTFIKEELKLKHILIVLLIITIVYNLPFLE